MFVKETVRKTNGTGCPWRKISGSFTLLLSLDYKHMIIFRQNTENSIIVSMPFRVLYSTRY